MSDLTASWKHYSAVRAVSRAFAAPLSEADQTVQSMPDASPTKWHLAHTSWFFECFILRAHLSGYAAFDDHYDFLFNSYYDAVGARQPRTQRGLLSRPPLSDILAFRAHVDAGMERVLSGNSPLAPEVAALVVLGLNHEQQHQELMATDLLHLFAQNPLRPGYAAAPEHGVAAAPRPLDFVPFAGGLVTLGHNGDGFHFDNEGPRHRVFLDPFALASRTVTNGEWCAFIADGGYETPRLWLSDGWARVQAEGWNAPGYWERATADAHWQQMSLNGLVAVAPDRPVVHVSYYEADAYARWAGARLPTEAEWEHASADVAVVGQFAEDGDWLPRVANGASAMSGLFGGVWEWTASAYCAYPGYQPAAGAVGEYNGKFMSNQFVLRGGSLATPAGHVRRSYRNFFYPHQRWQFSGLRLARSA